MHPYKTDQEINEEKASTIINIKFGLVNYGSFLYWHYLTIKEE